MRSYRHRIWDLIENFEAFNIEVVPRAQNSKVDRMAQIGSQFDPITDLMVNNESVRVIVRPTIPDNDENWQVFENNFQVLSFLQQSGEFADQLQPKIEEAYGDQIIQLKSNKLPKGLITLENLFDLEDASLEKKRFQENKEDYSKIQVSEWRKLKVGNSATQQERKRLIDLCEKYDRVIARTYEDLHGYDRNIIQHTIELTEGSKPVRQKQRPVNPRIEPLMVDELQKLLESRIIFPIKHSTWVSNLVPVRKKNGDIRLCVDFRDLNRASLKDHYPLPSME